MEQKTNGLAIASFVLSLCGIFTFGLTTFIGFILGIIALAQLKQRDERGEGMAITAIVLGSLLIVFAVVGLSVGATI